VDKLRNRIALGEVDHHGNAIGNPKEKKANKTQGELAEVVKHLVKHARVNIRAKKVIDNGLGSPEERAMLHAKFEEMDLKRAQERKERSNRRMAENREADARKAQIEQKWKLATGVIRRRIDASGNCHNRCSLTL
jgi:hypothetical protein